MQGWAFVVVVVLFLFFVLFCGECQSNMEKNRRILGWEGKMLTYSWVGNNLLGFIGEEILDM